MKNAHYSFNIILYSNKTLIKYLNVYIIKYIHIEYDPIKSEKNITDRNLPFSRAHDFDWSGAIVGEDSRYEYPELRYIAVGYLEYRLHVLCFTPIENGIRVISFRKANKREAKRNDRAIYR